MFLRSLALTLTIPAFAALPAAAATDGPWYLDPAKGLALVALLIFFAIVWRAGGFRIIGGALDSRSNEIQTRMDEAKSLRDQATKMLAEAERKQREASEEASVIVARAREDARLMVERAETELAARIARRQELAEARISRAEAEATAEVRRAAADAATAATRRLLIEKGTGDPFEQAAGEIERAFTRS